MKSAVFLHATYAITETAVITEIGIAAVDAKIRVDANASVKTAVKMNGAVRMMTIGIGVAKTTASFLATEVVDAVKAAADIAIEHVVAVISAESMAVFSKIQEQLKSGGVI